MNRNMKVPRKKLHVLQNIPMKNQNNHLNLWNQLLYLRPENDQHGSNPPYKKQKDIKLLVKPSGKERGPKDSVLSMQNLPPLQKQSRKKNGRKL